ncbi:MAG: ion transporter [Cyanobacteriota bacterium]|nr:ion transporter [Cyanobacteriota bacterium]
MAMRQALASYLEDIETPIGKRVNLGIALLVVISSGIFVAETYPIQEIWRTRLDILDRGILIVFGLEYLLRFWCAEKKLAYFFSFYSLIDLVAILPFIIGLSDIRFIRIFRWFRILRLIRFVERKTFFGLISSQDGQIFSRILFTLFAIIFVYSGLIYQVEHPVNGQIFQTFLDAVYFSVVTMTTVGFGDITPVSEGGRLLTVLMILTGIALIPWQVGDLIKRLVKSGEQVRIPCGSCGQPLHDPDALYCKVCGSRLPETSPPPAAQGGVI